MSEANEPDWLTELAKNTEALRRQIDQGGDALRRQVEQLGRAAEQFVRDARRATPGTGAVPPFQQRLVRAVDAAMRELVPPHQPVQHAMIFPAMVTGQASFGVPTITVTGSGSITMPKMGVAGEGMVQQPDLIERNVGRILALVLVAIVMSGLLGVQGPDRATVDHWATIIGVALTIAVLIWAGHK